MKKQKNIIFAAPVIATVMVDKRRNGRVVDCGGLENRCPGDWTGGSNPSFSAPALQAGPTSGPAFIFMLAPNKLACEEKSIKIKSYAPEVHN
jgi:hypothetical protein